jgi:hypothetical protein
MSMSPQSQSILMWVLALAVNATAICAGIIGGWDVFVQFLLPAFGSVTGASIVSYSLRR